MCVYRGVLVYIGIKNSDTLKQDKNKSSYIFAPTNVHVLKKAKYKYKKGKETIQVLLQDSM